MPLNRTNLVRRAEIIRSIRLFFDTRGFLEVETPHRIPANAPEEHIDPVPSAELFLHTSPELCMKRLLSQGYENIYQISRCWRSGERGIRHVPEFTMLEWYRSRCDYHDLMKDCEALLRQISESIGSHGMVEYDNQTILLSKGFSTITVHEAFEKFCNISVKEAVSSGAFDELMVSVIEPALRQQPRPVFLTDYPIEMAALARPKSEYPEVAERFELYAGGMELANGFSELNDVDEQRRRFEDANRVRAASGRNPLPIPEPFLRELEFMPPSAGIALGIDRLVMLFTGATRIDDVVAFTPEQL